MSTLADCTFQETSKFNFEGFNWFRTISIVNQAFNYCCLTHIKRILIEGSSYLSRSSTDIHSDVLPRVYTWTRDHDVFLGNHWVNSIRFIQNFGFQFVFDSEVLIDWRAASIVETWLHRSWKLYLERKNMGTCR